MFGVPMLPRTLEAALRDVTATKANTRATAVRELARYADEARAQVVPGLTRALRDEDADVRIAAATALADVRGDEALSELQVAIEDDHPMVRQMAISALGEIGDSRATERIRRALRDSRAEVRFQATIAFTRVCTAPDAVMEALLDATHDDDPNVCHIALRMLEEGAASEDGTPGPLDPRTRARAQALVPHPAAEVRILCAILLAPGGDRAAEAVLSQVARGEIRTKDRDDEASAIELAGTLGIEDAKPGLERRAFGGVLGLRRDPFAWNARVALARMGHDRARREILRELDAHDRDQRTLAVAAAGRALLVEAHDRIEAMRGNADRADPFAVDDALSRLTSTPQEAQATALHSTKSESEAP